MKRRHFLILVLNTILFSSSITHGQDRYPPGNRLPGFILRPQRTPMQVYDCGTNEIPQIKIEDTRKAACTKLNKKSWFSRIFRKSPKKYIPQPEEEFDVSGGLYVVLTNNCEIAALVRKVECNSSECKQDFEYKHCRLYSAVPTYPLV
ncbi:hypothetical protein OnM2_04581 [Erysiphe neolycopersici]|uniref:Secreted protein n=1 Tax=Erysiphe neolycopersici TaxID=212602 RepID=A0A420HAI8_9PEZI|nr:hypothetical protein OnM2_04581 [Erysiphe neolycopersici]